jgi:hypothetical protein
MGQFIVEVSATTNSVANTEDAFIEIAGATGTGFFLKRVRISTYTPASDTVITPRIVAYSSGAASGGSSAGTLNKKRTISPAATSTAYVKNGTTNFPLGTVSTTYDQTNVNGRAIWEWIPRGNEEYIDSGALGVLAIVVKCSAASVVINATAEIEE